MYCDEVWGNTYATNIYCLVVLQKRVIRLICGAKRLDNTNLLFHNVHILKLPDLVKLKTAIIMFKAYRYILHQRMYKHCSKYMNHNIHPGINVSSSKSTYVLTYKIMCVSVI